MEDYNRVLEATEVSENASGTAAEKMSVYTETLTAAQNNLTSSIQQFAQDSNLDQILIAAYNGLAKVVDILNTLLNKIPVLSPLIKALGVALAAAFVKSTIEKAKETGGAIDSLIKSLLGTQQQTKATIGLIPALQAAFTGLTGVINGTTTASAALNAVWSAMGGGVGVAIAAIGALIALLPSAVRWFNDLKNAKENALKQSSQELDEANQNLEETNSQIKDIQNKIAEIDSKDGLTLTDQAEKERLEEQLDTLKQIKQVQEDIANAKKAETLQATKDVINEKYGDTSTSSADYYQAMTSGVQSDDIQVNLYDAQSASIEQLTANIEYLDKAKKELSETDSNYQVKLDQINQLEAENRQQLLSQKEGLLDYKQQLIELGDTSSEEYQLVNDRINDITIALDPSKFPKIDLGEMIQTENMENKIKMVVQSGSEAGKKVAQGYAESLAKEIESDPVSLEAWKEALNIPDSQELGVDQLTQEITSLLYQMYGNIGDASTSAATQMQSSIEAAEAYQETLINLQSETESVTDAYKDMIDKGYISESVLKKLIKAHPELVNELKIENGQYKINIQTLIDANNATIDKAIADIKAQKEETEATIEQIKKRILAYQLEVNLWSMDPNITEEQKSHLIGVKNSIDISTNELNKLLASVKEYDREIGDLEASKKELSSYTGKSSSKKTGSKKSGKSDAQKQFETDIKNSLKYIKSTITKYSKDGFGAWDSQEAIDAAKTKYAEYLKKVTGSEEARKVAAEQLGVDLTGLNTEQQIAAITEAIEAQYGTIESKHQKLAEEDLQAKQKILSAAKEAAEAEKKEYDDALKNIQNLESVVESMLEKGISLLQKAGDLLFDMIGKISNKYDKQLENLDKISDELDKQKDAFDEKIDKQKEMLKLQKEEMDNADELADKNKSIADIDAQLMELQYDNSAEAQAKRLKLLDERAEKEKDLADWQKDNDYDTKIDALDKEKSEYEKTIEAEKKALEAQKQTIQDAQTSFGNTLSKIQSAFNSFTSFLNSGFIKRTLSKVLISYGGDDLKNALYVYNDIFGDGLRSTIDQTYDYFQESAKKFNWKEGTWIGDIENLLSSGSYDAQQRINILEKGSTQLSNLLKQVQAGQFDMSKAFGSGGFVLSDFTDTVNAMTQKFGDYKNTVLKGLQTVGDGVANSLKRTGDTVLSLFKSFTKSSDNAIDISENGAGGLIQTAIKGIKSIFNVSDSSISKIATNGVSSMNIFGSSGKGIISNLGNFAVKALQSIGNTTGSIVQVVFKGISQMVGGLGQGIGQIGSVLGNLFGGIGGSAALSSVPTMTGVTGAGLSGLIQSSGIAAGAAGTGTVGTGAAVAGGAGLAGGLGALAVGGAALLGVGAGVSSWVNNIRLWKDKDKSTGDKIWGTLGNLALMLSPVGGIISIVKAFKKHHTGADYVKKQNPMLDKMLGLSNDETVSILRVGEAVVPTWANNASSSASNNRFTGSPFGSAVDSAVKSARASSKALQNSSEQSINISMPINIQGDADASTVKALKEARRDIINDVMKTINNQTRIGGYKNIKAATV